ncbi:hypothetical protein EMIHUDRAFT_218821 [Emiliania huxleyi CCMP1516]|uniref:CUB domain-containing protein n=2 Tax=Emiliania huxleyi TaxID=2903 RepID=A0A0D3I677_EMIH1|nr:hypothetical protein EMIHUDRAFT_218821 [Emiliania huxleyi CCMP1516]EOD06762.1 hypothetical protein EMIHUDRAFT_218821 [Emiliania huxleyi CCMP1516]|eukprot:XP_005759191.1 hypothetical protein EMIHUDRAFT_218821 [Emiliania huxleyi CCMP1516]
MLALALLATPSTAASRPRPRRGGALIDTRNRTDFSIKLENDAPTLALAASASRKPNKAAGLLLHQYLASFGETTGAVKNGDVSLADSTANSVGVTCGGGAAPVWCAEPPLPLAELCVSEDPIKTSGSTSKKTDCTTTTAHSKGEADKTDTKLNIGAYAELAPLFDETSGATKIGDPSLEESFTTATPLSEIDVASLLFLHSCAAVLALLLAAFLEPLLRGQVKRKSVERSSHAAISVPLLSSTRALRVGIVILFFLQDVCGTPAAPPVNVSSPCSLTDGGSCATSPNYPNSYGRNEACTISGVPQVGLETVVFDVEGDSSSYYDYDGNGDPTDDCPDYLTVNGKKYCGTSGPSGAVAEDGVIEWRSDGSVVESGWKARPCEDQLRNLIEEATITAADVSIYLPPGDVEIIESVVRDCSAYNWGGVVYALRSGAVSITGSTVSGCSARNLGGVVHAYENSGAVSITGSNVSSCSATYAGGVVYANANSGAVSITGSNVSSCSAGYDGGVVYAYENSGAVSITSSNVSSCSAGYHGGVVHAFRSGAVSITSSTVAGSSAGYCAA